MLLVYGEARHSSFPVQRHSSDAAKIFGKLACLRGMQGMAIQTCYAVHNSDLLRWCATAPGPNRATSRQVKPVFLEQSLQDVGSKSSTKK